MNKIELSDKEIALVWGILCWFDKPVTSVLKAKLYRHNNNSILQGKFDEAIQDRIVNLARFITERRDK